MRAVAKYKQLDYKVSCAGGVLFLGLFIEVKVSAGFVIKKHSEH